MLRKVLIYSRALLLRPFYFTKLKTDDKLHLNIGSGVDYRKNYINIDFGCNFKVDFISDGINAIKICKEESVDSIIISHVVNYMYFWEFEEFLTICKKKLTQNGIIIIENPDLDCIMQYMNNSEPLSYDFFESIRGIFAFAEDDVKNKNPYMPYKMAYRLKDLLAIFKKLGFKTEIQKPQIHSANFNRDLRIIITKY
jgi:predicted SAM-dependent methyltransferase